MNRFIVPLLGFVALLGLLGVGLLRLPPGDAPKALPSPFIGQPAPAFSVPELLAPAAVFSPQQMAGQSWLLNVWASWCVACLAEHPLLVQFAQRHAVPIVGLNYKDAPADATAWLAEHGNPYTHLPADRRGEVGLDYGVYGVPETYLIDPAGVIRFKHIGPLTAELLDQVLMPQVVAWRGRL